MLKGVKEILKEKLKSKLKRPPLQPLSTRSDQENENPNQGPLNITLINNGGAYMDEKVLYTLIGGVAGAYNQARKSTEKADDFIDG